MICPPTEKLLVPLLVPTTIRNAKPRNKLYKLSERGGLQRLVKPNGARLWWFAHRFAGRQKTLAMGVCPMIALAEIRRSRDVARKLVATGLDPSVRHKLDKQSPV